MLASFLVGLSAAHVLTTIGMLRDRGVTVRSLTGSSDLAAKEGRVHVRRAEAAAGY